MVESQSTSPESDRKKRVEQKSKEILQKAKIGEGEEGVVYGFFKKAIEGKSSDLARVTELHQALTDQVAHLEEVGASNAALRQLRLLYQEAGMGKYELTVKTKEGASRNEKLRATREKIKADIENFAENYADHHTMEVYARPRAEIEELRGELAEEVGKDSPSRSTARQKGYEIERREEDLRERVGGRMQAVDNANIRGRQIFSGKNRLRRMYEQEDEKSFEDLDQAGQGEKIAGAGGAYRDLLAGDEERQEAFDKLGSSGREPLSKIAELGYREEQLRANLAKAVEAGDAQAVNDLVSEIRMVRLSRRVQEKMLDASVGVRRVEQFYKETEEARAKLAGAILDEGLAGSGQEAKNVIKAISREVAAGFSSVGGKFKQAGIVVDVAGEVTDLAKGTVTEAAHKVGAAYVDAAREVGKSFGRITDQESGKIGGMVQEVRSAAEIARDKVSEKYHQGVHVARQTLDKTAGRIAAQSEHFGRTVEVGVARAIGGKDFEQRARDELERARREMEGTIADVDAQIKQRRNPHLEDLDERLLDQVIFVSPGAEDILAENAEPLLEEDDFNARYPEGTRNTLSLNEKMDMYNELKSERDRLRRVNTTGFKSGGRFLEEKETEKMRWILEEMKAIDKELHDRFDVSGSGDKKEGGALFEDTFGWQSGGVENHTRHLAYRDGIVQLAKDYFSHQATEDDIRAFYDQTSEYIGSLDREPQLTFEQFVARFRTGKKSEPVAPEGESPPPGLGPDADEPEDKPDGPPPPPTYR